MRCTSMDWIAKRQRNQDRDSQVSLEGLGLHSRNEVGEGGRCIEMFTITFAWSFEITMKNGPRNLKHYVENLICSVIFPSNAKIAQSNLDLPQIWETIEVLIL